MKKSQKELETQKERRKGCWREKERILDLTNFKPLDC